MSTTSTDGGDAGVGVEDLADIEAIVMARLDRIERAHQQEVAERQELRATVDDFLCEMSQMCGYLASLADRLRANS